MRKTLQSRKEASHERILEAAADAFLEHWYDDVTIVERAPHREVLRHAAAVVTHAGHGTVIKRWPPGSRWWRCRWVATSLTTPRAWRTTGRGCG
jgi:hypothetical protein